MCRCFQYHFPTATNQTKCPCIIKSTPLSTNALTIFQQESIFLFLCSYLHSICMSLIITILLSLKDSVYILLLSHIHSILVSIFSLSLSTVSKMFSLLILELHMFDGIRLYDDMQYVNRFRCAIQCQLQIHEL